MIEMSAAAGTSCPMERLRGAQAALQKMESASVTLHALFDVVAEAGR